MDKVKKILNRIFIDGLGAMGFGLFGTLIIGTIIEQIGNLIGGGVGSTIVLFGKFAQALTGAGIGVATAYKFKESMLVTVSAASAGMIGAFAASWFLNINVALIVIACGVIGAVRVLYETKKKGGAAA